MDRFAWAVEKGNEGLWDWDLPAGRIHFSPRWHALVGGEGPCGSTPEEWFGRIPPGEREAVRSAIDAQLKEECGKFELEHRMLHADGSCRRVSCTGIITRDPDGRAVRIAGAHTDITAAVAVDPETGLAARHFFLDRAARSLLASQRDPQFVFAVMLLAIDRPEAAGGPSESGGALVPAAARRLETRMKAGYRPSSSGRDHAIAHAGAGEFLILLEGLGGADEAQAVADRLLGEMAEPFRVGDREIFAAVSAGIAVSASGYENPQDMLRDADTALHRARSLGGGRAEFFDTAGLAAARRERALESDLRRALAARELRVAYQPIIDLSSGRIAGFEALVRWRHPERGEVSPAEFIPIAERTGLIGPVGLGVLREACRQVKAWKRSAPGAGEVWVSVNVSPVQLRGESFVREAADVLREEEYAAGSLVLEVTESGIMENAQAAVRLLMQLRLVGVRVAIDDFGTGHSSLSRLCGLPLDFLKIDPSFVRGTESGKDMLEVVRSISELAGRLGLGVIAEGIETPALLERVRSLGCGFGQGFLFSRPVDGEAAGALLQRGLVDAEGSAVPAPRREGAPGGRRGGGRWRVGWALAALAALVLLGMGYLREVPDKAPRAPVAALAVEPGTLDPETPIQARAEPPPPVAATEETPPADYSFPVVHDHRIGSCSGKLRLTSDTLSYIGGKRECRFSAEKSAYSCRLEDGKLVIRAGGKTYRFHPEGDSREVHARRLREIQGYIARLHPEAAR
ncbi:MAG: EAL domain-containing protein [Acidobacteria bacterium]|nr:EAL domain-containing protein [Acidobacteriota bacterium]